jgi:hypothetical protein
MALYDIIQHSMRKSVFRFFLGLLLGVLMGGEAIVFAGGAVGPWTLAIIVIGFPGAIATFMAAYARPATKWAFPTGITVAMLGTVGIFLTKVDFAGIGLRQNAVVFFESSFGVATIAVAISCWVAAWVGARRKRREQEKREQGALRLAAERWPH